MSVTDVQRLEQFIPSYLAENDKKALLENLKAFEAKPYYTTLPKDLYLQGDGWAGLQIISLQTKEMAKVKALCISNSCDIAQETPFPNKVVFSPIVSVEKYVDLLKNSGAGEDRINSFYKDLRGQGISNLFYLPPSKDMPSESLINLGDLYSAPSGFFSDEKNAKQLLFRLSQMGHYLLLLKISIHFCRFWENVKRS